MLEKIEDDSESNPCDILNGSGSRGTHHTSGSDIMSPIHAHNKTTITNATGVTQMTEMTTDTMKSKNQIGGAILSDLGSDVTSHSGHHHGSILMSPATKRFISGDATRCSIINITTYT